jgi:hypothetical protein
MIGRTVTVPTRFFPKVHTLFFFLSVGSPPVVVKTARAVMRYCPAGHYRLGGGIGVLTTILDPSDPGHPVVI